MKIAKFKARFNSLKYAFINGTQYVHIGLQQILYNLLLWIDNLIPAFNEFKYNLRRNFIEAKDYSKDLITNHRLLHNRQFLKAFVALVAVVFLLSQSFSWLYDEYVGSGASITMGSIYHDVIQYDENGNIIAEDSDEVITMIYETNMSNITKNSKYIEVKNVGSLDMEYSLAFSLEGSVSGVAGIMYYRLYEITDEVMASNITAQYDTRLKAYAAANPIASNVETDTGIPVSNMTNLNNLVKIDQIYKSEKEEENSKYYRLDYGVYQVANTSSYNEESISVHLNVYSSQIGTLGNESLTGQVWEVATEAQLREVLISALAGDTIKLVDNVVIDGSLNISKRIHIDTNDYALKVSGDLIYDFMNTGNLNIDVTGNGTLTVGNNMTLNTPKAQVTIIGENKQYDMVVGGDFNVNALQDGEEDGLYLDNVRIVKSSKSLVPIDMIVSSNTRVTVGTEVIVGTIYAKKGSTNVEVVNNGTITQLRFEETNLLTTFTKAQIYVYNLGEILGIEGSTSIVLPDNATPYLGPNNGNTLIVKGVTSGDITISGSDNFGGGDIDDNLDDVSVVPIEGEDNAYFVYIKDSKVSVESLLTDYFEEEGSSDPSVNISQIRKLVIKTINAQYFENEDFDFLKSDKIPVLEYLDLESAKVIDYDKVNVIKDSAMSGKNSLTTLILPKYVTEIGESAFKGCPLGYISQDDLASFQFLTIPSNVTKIGSNAFDSAKYVKFNTLVVPTISSSAFDTSSTGVRIFVPESTISEFLTLKSLNSQYIYHTAMLDDDGRYFIYKYEDGMGIAYVLSNYTSSSSYAVTDNVTYQGTSYPVTAIGVNSFRSLNLAYDGTVALILPETVLAVGDYAFYGLKFNSVGLNNAKTIGNYSFYNNKFTRINAGNVTSVGDYAFYGTPATTLATGNLQYIGNYAFANATNLFSISMGDIKRIGDYAFDNTPNVAKVYMNSTNTIEANGQENIDLEVGTKALFNSWGNYVDGRLRVYVPDGTTIHGTTYLSLYQKMFPDYAKYIYVTGIEVGEYYHIGVTENLSEYTVRQVTRTDVSGNTFTGYEIICYQGADLATDYTMPNQITANGVTDNVISIGDYAYANAKISNNETITVSNDQVYFIGNHAFENLDITYASFSKATWMGEYAFYGTKMLEGKFASLTTIGSYAISGIDELAHLTLGPVNNYADAAISNNKHLQQLFINDSSMNITVTGTPFENIGTETGGRLRIYVPDSEAIITYYKKLMSNYADYIYATGTIVGSFINDPINYDIGEYSIRDISVIDKDGNMQTSWEVIEYHGEDLSSDYEFPETLVLKSADLTSSVTLSAGPPDIFNPIYTYSVSITNNSDYDVYNLSFRINKQSGVTINRYQYASGGTQYTELKMEEKENYWYFYSEMAFYNSFKAGQTITYNIWVRQESPNYIPDLKKVLGTSMDEIATPVISIGKNAYKHVESIQDSSYDFSSNNLLQIDSAAFASLNGLNNVNFPNVVTVGTNAFAGSTVHTASFENAYSIATGAFSNCTRLARLELFDVKKLDSGTFVNNPYLLQVFFTGSSTTKEYAMDAFNNVGTNTNDRLRFYVKTGIDSVSGEQYVDIYRKLFDTKYETYFYAYDTIMGSYTMANTDIDIGEYAVINGVNGYEISDYHGKLVDATYTIPTTFTGTDGVVKNVIAIGDYAYAHVAATEKFVLTNDIVERIGIRAFYGFEGFNDVTFNAVTNIGNEAFRNSSIRVGVFPKLVNVADYAFANNNGLYSLDLGTTTVLPDGLLYYDINLVRLYFGNTDYNTATGKMSITVNEGAFNNTGTNVGKLFRIYVPNGSTSGITYVTAYKNTVPLEYRDYVYEKGIIVGSYKPSMIDFDIGEYSIKKETYVNRDYYNIIEYHGNVLLEDYSVPGSFTVDTETLDVYRIGDYAYYFANVDTKLNLNLDSSINEIGNYAFYQIPVEVLNAKGVVKVESNAFANNSVLKNVLLDNVTNIGEYAFYKNTSLATVRLGLNVSEIGNFAFYNSWDENSISAFYASAVNPPVIYANTLPSNLGDYGIKTTVFVPRNSLNLYQEAEFWKDYLIEPTGEVVDNFVFEVDNDNLEATLISYIGLDEEKVTIPNTITVNGNTYNVIGIASDAFDAATVLETLEFADSIKLIDDGFINNNSSIKNIIVPAGNLTFSSVDGVLFDKGGNTLIKYPPAKDDVSYTVPAYTSVIASDAFANVGSLESITFNSDLSVISNLAFTNCRGLVSFTFTSTNPPYLLGFNTFTIYENTEFNYPSSATETYKNSLYYYKYRNLAK